MIKTINLIKIISFSFLLFFLLDATIGKYLYKKFIKKQTIDVITSFGEKDKIYDHKFVKNYNSLVGWGNLRYKLCTDESGFRISCNQKKIKSKKFDIGFIGDSFTEGTGLEYEQTFVGLISKQLNDKQIINLGMTSYSPSIYFAKINQLIKEGYEFGEIILFMDISDLVDDTLCYKLVDQVVVRRDTYRSCYNNINLEKNKFSKFIKKNFKFTTLLSEVFIEKLSIIKKSNNDSTFRNVINRSRAEWTYNYKKKNFNNLELEEAFLISKTNMNKLSKLLKENSIDLSIAVYPWPGTLKYDVVENQQVVLWKNFCINKCKNFYNFMPYFFNRIDKKKFYESYLDYYIDGDIHFNSFGNKIIADEFLKQFNN